MKVAERASSSKGKDSDKSKHSFDENKKRHILQNKHNWNELVPNPKDPNNWGKIAAVISKVMEEGTSENYKGTPDVYVKTLKIGEKIVQVTYKIVNCVKRISDAWVK